MDFVAASFMRRASDVQEVQDYIAAVQKEVWHDQPDHPKPLVISKVMRQHLVVIQIRCGTHQKVVIRRGRSLAACVRRGW